MNTVGNGGDCMEDITHAQVQELVNNLPETKLSLAFHFLQDLAEIDTESLSQEDYARLDQLSPGDSFFDECRQLLAQQAELMKDHYEQTEDVRADWQAGDFSGR